MFGVAQRAALLELFPRAVELLARVLEATARRDVKVEARAYAPTNIKGVATYVGGEGERILSTWPGEQLSLAVDGDQSLTALLSKDVQSVHQAIWSNSTYLSCLQYNALHSELELTELARGSAVRTVLGPLSLTRLRPPGFAKLNERYSETSTMPARKKSTLRYAGKRLRP
jgi:HTH-type transcriptional regulator, sugar sensing transcriptional regulator